MTLYILDMCQTSEREISTALDTLVQVKLSYTKTAPTRTLRGQILVKANNVDQ